jgi:hypothetical protein
VRQRILRCPPQSILFGNFRLPLTAADSLEENITDFSLHPRFFLIITRRISFVNSLTEISKKISLPAYYMRQKAISVTVLLKKQRKKTRKRGSFSFCI